LLFVTLAAAEKMHKNFFVFLKKVREFGPFSCLYNQGGKAVCSALAVVRAGGEFFSQSGNCRGGGLSGGCLGYKPVEGRAHG